MAAAELCQSPCSCSGRGLQPEPARSTLLPRARIAHKLARRAPQPLLPSSSCVGAAAEAVTATGPETAAEPLIDYQSLLNSTIQLQEPAPADILENRVSRDAAANHLVVDGIAIGRQDWLHRLWWGFGCWLHHEYFSQVCEGLEHLPLDQGAFIIASNHQSHLDCSAVYVGAWAGGVQRMYALGARDYFFKNALLRWFVTRLMNVIPFNRKGFTQKDVDRLLELAALALPSAPAAVLMFPEGTRAMSGGLGAFKAGVGYLAAVSGLPVVPAYVTGTAAALPKGTWVPLRKQVRVRFGAPLKPPAACAAPEGGNCSGAAAARKEALSAFAQQLRAAVQQLGEQSSAAHRDSNMLMRSHSLPTQRQNDAASSGQEARMGSGDGMGRGLGPLVSRACAVLLAVIAELLHQLERGAVRLKQGMHSFKSA